MRARGLDSVLSRSRGSVTSFERSYDGAASRRSLPQGSDFAPALAKGKQIIGGPARAGPTSTAPATAHAHAARRAPDRGDFIIAVLLGSTRIDARAGGGVSDKVVNLAKRSSPVVGPSETIRSEERRGGQE